MMRALHCSFILCYLLNTVPLALALTFEEFQFRLTEAQTQKEKTEAEVRVLSEKLAEMKRVGTAIDERKHYSEELITAIKYLEDLKKKLKELRALYPEVKVTPLYKLVRIDPSGVPGRYGESTFLDQDIPYALASLRLKSFPTEITAGESFTISGDVLYREKFSEKGHCYQPTPNSARLGVSLQTYRSESDPATPQLIARYQSRQLLTRLCSDAPVDFDPETRHRLQAAFEKDTQVEFTSRFLPIRTEKDDEGLFTYSYKMETTSSGERVNSQTKALLFSETDHTSTQGVCVHSGAPHCGVFRIAVGGSARGFHLVTSLIYKQIADGETFITHAPSYSHPAAFGEAPTVGSIRLGATVPNLIGLSTKRAKKRLQDIGFLSQVTLGNQAPSKEKEFTVTHQSPSHGIKLKLGSTVTIKTWARYVPPAPQLTPNESCNRDWPGSVSSGHRSPDGGWNCVCPSGQQWNDGRTGCVQTPQITPDQSCNQDWPGSVSSGKRSANGGWDCICPAGQQWTQGRTACIRVPQLTPDQSCNRDWPGSVSSGNRSTNGGWDCVCPAGQQWNQDRTACVNTPSMPQPNRTKCHPWQRESKLTLPFGETTICECLYGSAINSMACLPPRPPGQGGCPPGTRKEYSRPDGLGLGCECIYGSEKGVCRLQ
ncbi:MAG: PASTA domain-containing protein [Bdellovibrionales bacterium]|nr:PASTA domain-containing protein [Bdellovibrionales bacterium]